MSHVHWSGVVTCAYFLHTITEFFILGAVVGIVLGDSQALSRSFYGAMIRQEASAEFYGFYSVFSKFSAIWGPLAFAIFIVGWAIIFAGCGGDGLVRESPSEQDTPKIPIISMKEIQGEGMVVSYTATYY